MEQVVASGDIKLHVREWGDSARPTVVLVHGWPDSSAIWTPVAELLADRYHVVAYDVRGTGLSTAPDGTAGYRLELLVGDLGAVLDATSPEAAVHLVGHDWGSIQSWEAVTTEQLAGRIASFTTISGPSLDHMGALTRTRIQRRQVGAILDQNVRSSYVAAFHLPGSGAGWRRLARVWPQVMAREGAVVDAYWPAPTLGRDGANGQRLYRANVRQRVLRPRDRRTDIPVQLIVLTRDRFVPAPMVGNVEDHASRLWRRELGSAHWAPRSHPAAVARMVGEFVEHVEHGVAPPSRTRVAVVTGAGSGIGRSTALAFGAEGAAVVVADIDEWAANRTAELIRLAGGSAFPYVVDVGDTAAMESFATWVAAEVGVPSVVVNNAGIGMAGAFLDTSVADWERILRVNLWGVIHGSRLFAAQMAEYGEGGHIVNVASAAAFAPNRSLPAYSTTKAAVLMLTECLRAELADSDIGVSAICPGFIDTNITRSTKFVGVGEGKQAQLRSKASRMYHRRSFGPEKVAAAIVEAVRTNKPVAAVSVEAKLMDAMGRFTPSLARRFARADVSR